MSKLNDLLNATPAFSDFARTDKTLIVQCRERRGIMDVQDYAGPLWMFPYDAKYEYPFKNEDGYWVWKMVKIPKLGEL